MNEFNPDWCISPGEHLQEYLDFLMFTPEEFSSDIPIETVNQILANEISINPELKIGDIFKQGEQFWLNLQKLYDKPL